MTPHDDIRARRRKDRESGQAMVEFALILFPLLLLGRRHHPVRHRSQLLARHAAPRQPGRALGGRELVARLPPHAGDAGCNATPACTRGAHQHDAPALPRVPGSLERSREQRLREVCAADDGDSTTTTVRSERLSACASRRRSVRAASPARHDHLRAAATMRIENNVPDHLRLTPCATADVNQRHAPADRARPGHGHVRAPPSGLPRARWVRHRDRELVHARQAPADEGRRRRVRRRHRVGVPVRLADRRRGSKRRRALYAGPNNPQIGGVPNSSIHTVLNGSALVRRRLEPRAARAEQRRCNASVCAAKILDVKVTEDNSFPLASLIPLFPDIKRKARIEIQEAEGISGLLPIAVRAPEPVSAAAVFYNESTGNDPRREVPREEQRHLPDSQRPPGMDDLQHRGLEHVGATSRLRRRRVLPLAISFRGACDTSLPNPNTKITTTAAPCFEDNYVGQPINTLCNQGSSTQIVNCYYATGTWPTESVQSGLQFIRGYGTRRRSTTRRPQVRSAYLENVSCQVSGVNGRVLQRAPEQQLPGEGARRGRHLARSSRTRRRIRPNTTVRDADRRQRAGPLRHRARRRLDVLQHGNQCDLQYSGSPNATGVVEYSSQGSASSPHAAPDRQQPGAMRWPSRSRFGEARSTEPRRLQQRRERQLQQQLPLVPHRHGDRSARA